MRVPSTLGLGAAFGFLLTQAASALPSTPPSPSAHRGVQLAALFGESDEEKAARQQHEDNQDATIQTLNQRVRDLESSLRQQTGQNEELSHRIQELNDKLDRQQKDFEYRLCAMTAQQLGATPGQPGDQTLPCSSPSAQAAPSAGAAMGPATASAPPQGGVQLGKPPGVLGTLSTNDAVPLPPPPPSNAQPQFDSAMNLLAKAQYDDARAAFRAFADANPKDALAPQAVYWIGDIAYVQKDYPGAAHAFAEEIKKYPTSTRAPDSMLKLGQSMIAMGQKKEGCIALGALPSKYPNASKAIATQAASARKAACR
jgi:tol-pal system protein YbgF